MQQSSLAISAGHLDQLEERVSGTLGRPIAFQQGTIGPLEARLKLRQGSIFSVVDASYSQTITASTDGFDDSISLFLVKEGDCLMGGSKVPLACGSVAAINDSQLDPVVEFLGPSDTLYVSACLSAIDKLSYLYSKTQISKIIKGPFIFQYNEKHAELIRKAFLSLPVYMDLNESSFADEYVLKGIEEFCACVLIRSIMSSLSTSVAASEPTIGLVRLADIVAYCRAAKHPLLVSEIAERFDLSVRSIELAFRRHLSTSPREFIQTLRIEAVHSDLCAWGPQYLQASARHWGFANHARLKSAFIRRFGPDEWQRLARRA